MLDAYDPAGFSVVVASMGVKELAETAAKDWDLGRTRVAYDVTVEDAKNWGLWISKAFKDVKADIFTEPGLFWVRPVGRLYLADISNMPWARPDLKMLKSKVSYALEKIYPARSTYVG